jgi:nucleoside-diphosphate-sugar epimerase
VKLAGRQAVIFGGAGFIGGHLARRLARKGADVLIADHQLPRAPLAAGITYVTADVREPIAFEPARPDPLVFNLAAVHRTPGHPDHEYFETNLAGAENVTAFCADHGVTTLFFTSSISVYGPTEVPVDEDSALEPTSAYGFSKRQAEEIHRAWVESAAGRRLVVVRPAAVFGPGENGNFTRLATALRRGTFLYPGRKDARKACGYVDDLVGSMLFMADRADPVVTYNFAYPTPPTIEEICATFVAEGKLKPPRGVVPAPPVMAAARVLSGIGLKTFDPARIRKVFTSTNVEAKALAAAGYPYETDLAEGIRRWRDADPSGEFV